MQAHIAVPGTCLDMDRARIGDLVRLRREALRLTVRGAASLTDGEVPYSTWSQIETGRLNWTADKLAHVLYALGCRLEVDLRTGRADPREDARSRVLIDRLAAIVVREEV